MTKWASFFILAIQTKMAAKLLHYYHHFFIYFCNKEASLSSFSACKRLVAHILYFCWCCFAFFSFLLENAKLFAIAFLLPPLSPFSGCPILNRQTAVYSNRKRKRAKKTETLSKTLKANQWKGRDRLFFAWRRRRLCSQTKLSVLRKVYANGLISRG